MNYMDLNSESIRGFIESPEWTVFEGEVKDRLEAIRGELEKGITLVSKTIPSPDGVREQKVPVVLDYGGIRERQGECKSLRWILSMPKLLQELQADKEQKLKEVSDVSQSK